MNDATTKQAKRIEFLSNLVAKLNAGEITKAQGRKAIRAYDAAVKREDRMRVALTVEQVISSLK